MISLNRAVAVSRLRGPAAGLRAVAEVARHPAFARYYLLPATLGELWRALGDRAKAAAGYRRALECPCTEPERRFLAQRLAELAAAT